MSSHPEFICVGAQKAGTSWLYDQARSHPRVWMPPIKELRYFNKFGRLAERATAQLEKMRKRQERKKPVDPRDLAFLIQASKTNSGFKTSTLEEYIRCFEPAGGLFTGDISPAYASLGEKQIFVLAKELPRTRFIFFLRDPIERLWSDINMMVRYEKVDETALSNLADFKQLVESPRCRTQSFQSRHIQRWNDIMGSQRFRVFRMDDLKAEPPKYRRSVFGHIGLDGDECAIAADFNKKSGDRKALMPEDYRGFLQEYFEEEYEQLSQLRMGV